MNNHIFSSYLLITQFSLNRYKANEREPGIEVAVLC